MKNIIYQQGDCILKRCGTFNYFKEEFNEIPSSAKKIKGNLLLKGANNSHALYGGKFQLYKNKDMIFVDVLKETVLDHVQDHLVKKPKHAEHHSQKIKPGQYFVDELLEYDHALEESRRIID